MCALKKAGYPVQDVATYRRLPDSKELLRNMRKQFDEVTGDWPVGCALVMLAPRSTEPRHLGVYVGSNRVIDVIAEGRVLVRRIVPGEVVAAFKPRKVT